MQLVCHPWNTVVLTGSSPCRKYCAASRVGTNESFQRDQSQLWVLTASREWLFLSLCADCGDALGPPCPGPVGGDLGAHEDTHEAVLQQAHRNVLAHREQR